MNIIYSISLPYNHLLIISLIQTNDQHEKYTTLFTFVPGESGKDSNRTYNFQRKVTMKISIRDLPGLSMVLKKAGEGLDHIVLPYSKLTQSNNTIKILNIFSSTPKQKSSYQQETKMIMMSITAGDNKFAFTLTLPDSYSVGTIIEKIYEYALKLDMEKFEPKSYHVVKEDRSLEKSNFINQSPFHTTKLPFE